MSVLRPDESELFGVWTDPESGVTSYVLRNDVAPILQTFYFTNGNVTADGRYLWMYAAYPPANDHCLAVYDAATDEIRVYPETGFESELPWVDPETGAVVWAVGARGRTNPTLFQRGPAEDDEVNKLGEIGREEVGGREIQRLATHFVPSADGRRFNVEIQTPILAEGDCWHIGAYDIETDELTIWDSFDDHRYNHSQFHPTDPDLLLFAQDWYTDPATGEAHWYENRLWLASPDEGAWPIFEETGEVAHEWWSTDGEKVWFVDYQNGTAYYDMSSEERVDVWPGGTCHSHASADDRLLVGDVNPYSWAEDRCHVAFYDRETETAVDIVSDLPYPADTRDRYHVDPHPQFVCDDEFVVYTTTVGGEVSLALTRVDELLECTR